MTEKTKNIRLDLSKKWHDALYMMGGNKKRAATEIIMKSLIKDGLVKPSKHDRIWLGIE